MIAILTVSHGTSDPQGQEAIRAYADAVHAAVGADLAAHAFVDVQQPDLPAALAALPAHATVVVVPLLLSRGYHLGHDIPAAVAPFGDRVVVADALGPDHRIAQVLLRRLHEAGVGPEDRVVLAAAGSSDSAGVQDALQAGLLLEVVARRPVTVGFLSAAHPRLDDAVARNRTTGDDRVALGSYLLAPGYFLDRTRECPADVVAEPLLTPATAPAYELIAVARDRYSTALSASAAASAAGSVAAARRPRTSATDDATAP